MRPDFSLGIIDNAGDRLSYEILHVRSTKDIPHLHRPVTLVKNIGILRDSESTEVPRCIYILEGFIFTNMHGDKILVSEETITSTSEHDVSMPHNINGDSNEMELIHQPDLSPNLENLQERYYNTVWI